MSPADEHGARARIVHVSDIHLGADDRQREDILGPLVRALRAERDRWGDAQVPTLLAITGDLHDTPSRDVSEATHDFVAVLARLRGALGGDVPTVLLPGNHDRRTHGLLLPYRTSLMDALVTAKLPNVLVAGVSPPFLGQLVPDDFHGLPFSVAAVDSSYTPSGFVGAGGVLRAEDFLELAQALETTPKGRPLLLLTHHHLVPTPVTDTSAMDVNTPSPLLRWLAKNVLTRIIPYADHEEWMMTALGAGTALSTLAALGRPVLVLHGHKHYPTVRALSATTYGHGDVLLLSAGSAGLALPISDVDEEQSARLWPSFHVLAIAEGAVTTETVAFYKDAEPARRQLLSAKAVGTSWDVAPVSPNIKHGGPSLVKNVARFRLSPSAARTDARWDVEVVRTIDAREPVKYVDLIHAPDGAAFLSDEPGAPKDPDARSFELPTNGRPYKYVLRAGAVRTVREALDVYGPLGPFEGALLLNRYEAREARLEISGLPAGVVPFGSTVDLTRGQASPCPLERVGDGWVLALRDAAPRLQLRIQWRPSP